MLGKLVGWLFNKHSDSKSTMEVSDSSGVGRTVYDEDGYLYQRDAKLTPSGTEINVLAAVTPGTAKASSAVVLDANKTIAGLNRVDTTVAHDYAAGAVDWTLSATERKADIIMVTNANGAVNAIFNIDTPNYYLIDNQSGQALTCKNASGASVVIASTKRAILWNNGTAMIRITADA